MAKRRIIRIQQDHSRELRDADPYIELARRILRQSAEEAMKGNMEAILWLAGAGKYFAELIGFDPRAIINRLEEWLKEEE